jgi:hypothetical protein
VEIWWARGARTPFGPAARRPFRFAQGIFEDERPSTLRMWTSSVGTPTVDPTVQLS